MACSSCVLPLSFLKNCGLKIGGGNYATISVIPFCQVDTAGITVDPTDGFITAIPLVTPLTDDWLTIECRINTLLVNEDLVVPGNFVNQTITFTIDNLANDVDKVTAAQLQSNFINALANDDGLMVVVRNKAGIRYLLGKTTGLTVSAMQKTSGTVSTDLAGTTITLSEVQPEFAFAIDASVINDNIILPS